MRRFLLLGLILWFVGMALIRLTPARFLPADRPAAILVLYVVSFGVMFVVMRQLVARPQAASNAGLAGIALVLPTLLLDAFAAAFFPVVYPNLPAHAAGVFGGWMMIICGGGLLAVLKGK
jgi:hypothetical protein